MHQRKYQQNKVRQTLHEDLEKMKREDEKQIPAASPLY